jgi:phosphate uptake regulator
MTAHSPASHLIHDELASPAELAADCRSLLVSHRHLERAASAATQVAPSLHSDDYPAEVGKREIRVSDAAARLARALYTD